MSKRTDSGFTLIEVLIALAVTGALLVTLLYTLNHHLSVADAHESTTVATMLGVEKISELSVKPRDEKGTFPPPNEDYSYVAEATESQYLGITEITVTVTKDRERLVLRKLQFEKDSAEKEEDENP